MTVNSPKTEIEKILDHSQPSRFVYAPNYWQWFKHQQDHGLLPAEISQSNLGPISSLGVDGLEGVAFPPLGDVSLMEAMESTREDFIITGGISAMESRDI